MKELIEILKERQFSYKINGDTVIVDNKLRNLYLDEIEEIKCNVIFINDGYVYLSNLQEITTNIEFNNIGYVDLAHLEEITGNVVFNNTGYVTLENVTNITGTLNFGNNIGICYVEKLDLTTLSYENLIKLFQIKTDRTDDIVEELEKRSGLNMNMLI